MDGRCAGLIFIGFLCLAQQGLSLDTIQWTHSLSLGREGEVLVLWKPMEESFIFEIQGRTHGYVGLGFTPTGGMGRADIVIGWINPNGNVMLQDYHGVGNTMPVLDQQQDYTVIGGYENETHTVIRFVRKWDTCDDHDMPLGTDTVRMMWAYNPEDPPYGEPIYHGPYNRGTKSVYLTHPPLSSIAERLGPHTQSWDIKMEDKYVDGSSNSLYWCKIVKAPKLDKKHHIVGFVPILQPENAVNVHHIDIYECAAPDSNAVFDKYLAHDGAECYTPNMPPEWGHCLPNLINWSVGSEGQIFPEDFGLPIGEDHGGATYFMMELHYDNPGHRQFVDNSGVRFFYSDKLREEDGSTISLGQRANPFQVVPPRQHKFTSYTYCPADCTSKSMPTGGAKIFSVLLHAHTAAIAIRLRHIRKGKELPLLAQDRHYDFNYQQARVLPQEVRILPGDEFIVECDYHTGRRERPTYGGATTREEMCQAFVTYYPRIPLSRCFSSPSLETFFNGLKIEALDDFDFHLPHRTDDIFQHSYDVSQKKKHRVARSTIINMDPHDLWGALTIKEPRHLNNMSVLQYFRHKKWHNRQDMSTLEEFWKKGKYEVWCTAHGMSSIPLDNELHQYPDFIPLPPPVKSSKCHFHEGSFRGKGVSHNGSLLAITLGVLLAALIK